MYFINLQRAALQQQIKELCRGKSGIYQITNLFNKKKYIGSAVTKKEGGNRLYIRFRNHFFNQHKEFPCKRAIKKYGVHSFSWEILEFTDISETRDKESAYIKKLLPEYNVLQVADSSIGYQHTAETKEKMKAGFSACRRKVIGSFYKKKKRSLEERERAYKAALAKTPAQKKKDKDMCTLWNTKQFSKPTQILEGEKLSVLGNFSSLREAATAWKGNYRTFKRAVKSGKKIYKYNIYVKYCS